MKVQLSSLSLLLLLLSLCSSPVSGYLSAPFPACGGAYMSSLRSNPVAPQGKRVRKDVCGGSYMKSVGALTDERVVPLAKNAGTTTRQKGCGGTYMNSLGAYPERFVPLGNDPRNAPDTVVYQKITPLLDRYNQQYKAKLEKQQNMAKSFHQVFLESTTPLSLDPDSSK